MSCLFGFMLLPLYVVGNIFIILLYHVKTKWGIRIFLYYIDIKRSKILENNEIKLYIFKL